MSTIFTAEQQALILGTVQEQKAAARAMQKAQERATGAYTGTIAVAIEFAADPDGFDEAMGELFTRIRANTDGIARAAKAEKAEKGGYKVPGALSSARSVLKGAFEFGVALRDEDGIRSFGAIRKDLRAAQQAEKDAERQPYEIARDELVAALREAAERVAKLETDIESGCACDDLRAHVEREVAELEALTGALPSTETVAEAA